MPRACSDEDRRDRVGVVRPRASITPVIYGPCPRARRAGAADADLHARRRRGRDVARRRLARLEARRADRRLRRRRRAERALGLVLAADLPGRAPRRARPRPERALRPRRRPLGAVEHEGRLRVTQEQVDALERDCDRFNADLPELKSFVLPGGSEAAARLHVARTVCRRAEREALAAGRRRTTLNPLALVYLNRLSDLLFILARAANAAAAARSRSGGLGARPSVRRLVRRRLSRLGARARARDAAAAV